jgi:hypothetical protein
MEEIDMEQTNNKSIVTAKLIFEKPTLDKVNKITIEKIDDNSYSLLVELEDEVQRNWTFQINNQKLILLDEDMLVTYI